MLCNVIRNYDRNGQKNMIQLSLLTVLIFKTQVKGSITDNEKETAPNLTGTLLSIFNLLRYILDELLLLRPFLILQAKCLILKNT